MNEVQKEDVKLQCFTLALHVRGTVGKNPITKDPELQSVADFQAVLTDAKKLYKWVVA